MLFPRLWTAFLVVLSLFLQFFFSDWQSLDRAPWDPFAGAPTSEKFAMGALVSLGLGTLIAFFRIARSGTSFLFFEIIGFFLLFSVWIPIGQWFNGARPIGYLLAYTLAFVAFRFSLHPDPILSRLPRLNQKGIFPRRPEDAASYRNLFWILLGWLLAFPFILDLGKGKFFEAVLTVLLLGVLLVLLTFLIVLPRRIFRKKPLAFWKSYGLLFVYLGFNFAGIKLFGSLQIFPGKEVDRDTLEVGWGLLLLVVSSAHLFIGDRLGPWLQSRFSKLLESFLGNEVPQEQRKPEARRELNETEKRAPKQTVNRGPSEGVLLELLKKFFEKSKTSLTEKVILPARNFIRALTEKKSSARKWTIRIAIPVGSAALLWILAAIVWNSLVLGVASATPTGVVSENIQIRITYPRDVEPLAGTNGSFVDLFRIEPPLAGEVVFPDSKTILFIPREKLKPATRYRVKLLADRLRSRDRRWVGGKRLSFETEKFRLVKGGLSFTADPVSGEEQELSGELRFNYPTSYESVLGHLELTLSGEKIPFELETSLFPDRFYLRTKTPARGDASREYKLRLLKGVVPIGGSTALGSETSIYAELPGKGDLVVEEIQMHTPEGKSLVSLRLNQPVSEKELEKKIRVEPKLPVRIIAEHRLAVIEGEFEPNVEYKVFVEKGLRSPGGHELRKEYKGEIKISDLRPEVTFVKPGRMMPLFGSMNLKFTSVNLDSVNVTVKRVYRNNLVTYLLQPYNTYNLGNGAKSFSLPVKGKLNRKNPSTLNLREYQDHPFKGLYQVEIRDPKSYSSDQITVLLTDIGLVVKRSAHNLQVTALSLKSLEPIRGLSLRLVSRENQVIAEQASDEEGRALFRNFQQNAWGLSPLVVTAGGEDDFTYYRLDDASLDVSRFEVDGEVFHPEALSSYLALERDLYRPGEKVNVTALVRKRSLELPPNVPVILELRSPNNNTQLFRESSRQGEMIPFELPIAADALTGEYRLALKLGETTAPIGEAGFKVEEFIPSRLKVAVRETFTGSPLEPVTFRVRANLLSGPPAKENKTYADVQFQHRIFAPVGYDGYTFTDPDRPFQGDRVRYGESKLDAAGEKEYRVQLPANLNPPSALTAYFYTEVKDESGRPVSATKSVALHAYPYYLGLKRSGDSLPRPGDRITLEWAVLSPTNTPVLAKNQSLLIYRKSSYSIFRKNKWGIGRFQSDTYNTPVLSKVVDVDGLGSFAFTAGEPGEYIAVIGNERSHRARIRFHVDVPSAVVAGDVERPRDIRIEGADRKFRAGEEARLRLRVPFDGVLLYSVERNSVLLQGRQRVSAGDNVLAIPIQASYFPNVYFTAVLVRTPDAERDQLPMTAYGVAPLTLDEKPFENAVMLDTPPEVSSAAGISVAVRTREPYSEVRLSVVDRGILDLTRFETPDPLAYFTKKVRLAVQTISLFDLVLPDYGSERGATGGDSDEADGRRHVNPVSSKRVKSYAYTSPVLHTDANGLATWSLPGRSFNGEVRVMALVAKGNSFGRNEKAVKIADRLMIEVGLPRAVAPGDAFFIPVALYNETGGAGDFRLRVEFSGPVGASAGFPEIFRIEAQDQTKTFLALRAGSNTGVAKIRVECEGRGESAVFEGEWAVRPLSFVETKAKSGSLKAGETAKIDIPPEWIRNGKRVYVHASPAPVAAYLRGVDSLIRYPYGCLEQTVSSIFPMLTLRRLGLLDGFFAGRGQTVDTYIAEGLRKIQEQQLSDGRFSYWKGSVGVNDYASLYASHALLLAEREGYAVKKETTDRIRTYLQGRQSQGNAGTLDRREKNVAQGTPEDLYRYYVSALYGLPENQSMEFLYEKKLKDLEDGERSLLALSFAVLGMKDKAQKCLDIPFGKKLKDRIFDGDFYSPTRAEAQHILAILELRNDRKEILSLIDNMGKRVGSEGHFGSTQENAWALLALARASEILANKTPVALDLLADGQTLKSLSGDRAGFSESLGETKSVAIKNLSAEPFYYVLLAEGTPILSPRKAVSQGIAASRRYLNSRGKEIDLNKVAQGDLIAVELTVNPKTRGLNHLAVVDLLPAGFEIENTRLASRGLLDFTPENTFEAEQIDIRDDRIVLFTGEGSKKMTYTYVVRAVTPGVYRIPEFRAEAMYAPEIFGRADSGNELVVAPVR